MNYKRILSNNSIKSASSFGNISETSELESLKQVIESLKTSIESRDTAIGTLAREKEKVFVELKSAQRTIRSLRQQLNDERTIFIKEKEYLAEELQRLSRKENSEIGTQGHSLKQKLIDEKDEEINSLKDQLHEKDETICKLCEKYMKLKDSKTFLHRKLERLKIEVEETRQTTMNVLEENKRRMDKTFRNMLKSSTISLDSKKYLKLLKENVKLSTENARLKLGLATNIHVDDKPEVKLCDIHKITSSIVEPLPQRPQPTPQKNVLSEEDFSFDSKPRRSRSKWHPFKLKNSNCWFSPALLGSLYRKNKSLSAQLLQESLRKTTSMPCLSLV